MAHPDTPPARSSRAPGRTDRDGTTQTFASRAVTAGPEKRWHTARRAASPHAVLVLEPSSTASVVAWGWPAVCRPIATRSAARRRSVRARATRAVLLLDRNRPRGLGQRAIQPREGR